MDFRATEQIVLDFTERAVGDLVGQLSGLALAPDGHLWTVSDEGRTVECLAPDGDGFRLVTQIDISSVIRDIAPGRDELDLESVHVDGTHLWIAGSHCYVRAKPEDPNTLLPGVHDRPSRHVIARFRIGDDGSSLKHPRWIAPTGVGSLRAALTDDVYLQRFLRLPSKENGLDIEGLVAADDRLLLGLRGPVLDGRAVVLALDLVEQGASHFSIQRKGRHFLDLGGLGIRDLCVSDGSILVLAGPVADAGGPFRLYRWQATTEDVVVHPELLCTVPSNGEKPEGVCVVMRGRRHGLAMVYDSPRAGRVVAQTYFADWAEGLA